MQYSGACGVQGVYDVWGDTDIHACGQTLGTETAGAATDTYTTFRRIRNTRESERATFCLHANQT